MWMLGEFGERKLCKNRSEKGNCSGYVLEVANMDANTTTIVAEDMEPPSGEKPNGERKSPG